MKARGPLKIRLLGELQLAHGDGPALTLPASKKTRALLGYLIATGQPHRRERLCDFFWDGPDDPRAELRWSLSKIRPLLSEGGASLIADRQRVGIELGNAAVDLLSVQSLLRDGVPAASTDALKQAAALFGGELLDGLDLPVCYRYQEWCMAEREAVSRLRLAVLAALIERLHDHPAEALAYARTLAVADPLSESGHAAVVRLLSRVGRNREALSHYERACRVFETELGAAPSGELEDARRALQSVPDTRVVTEPITPAPDTPPESARPRSGESHFVGRDAEHVLIGRIVATTAKRLASDVLLVTGEAGIGKSHLLAWIAERMIAAGGCAWSARGFEPEATRPYGIWFDILRAIVRGQQREKLPPNLGMLLPEVGAATDPGDRSRLFDAVVDLLRKVASERPVVIALDDIQWIDEASCSLLHYVARHSDAASGLLIVCAARQGEIEDNAAASSVLRSLSREQRLRKIALGRLGLEETMELVRLVDPALDGARIFAGSEGNPLFALELARAHRRGSHGSRNRRVRCSSGRRPMAAPSRQMISRAPRTSTPPNCSLRSANWSGADSCGRSEAIPTTSRTTLSGRLPIAPSRSRGGSCFIGISRTPWTARARATPPSPPTSPIMRHSPATTRPRRAPAPSPASVPSACSRTSRPAASPNGDCTMSSD
jgi:DNA-binding SARP family transcriptional activator